MRDSRKEPFIQTRATRPAAISLTSVTTSSGGTAIYTGLVTGGEANAYAGTWFFVSGFSQNDATFAFSNNDGAFLCTASSATTLTLLNENAAAQSGVTGLGTPGSTQPAYEAGLPRVLMTGIPRLRELTNPTPPTLPAPTAPDSTTLMYDNAAHGIATSFSQDGLQVSIAEVRQYLNTSGALAYGGDLYSLDLLHPNTQGHQHVRDAYEAAIVNGIYQARAFAPTARSCGTFTTAGSTSDTYLCSTLTPNSRCFLQPTNAVASSMVPPPYIQSKSFGSVLINHPATAGAKFDVVCTQN